jgi:1,4-alpha-glucan branching enzyme
MRRAMIDALSFWVTNTGIDGFRCDAADYVPFDFWQQAIDSLHRRHGEGLILLAEGARADHFAAGFQMNYGWSFYGSLQQVFNQNAAVATLWSTHNAEYSPMPPGTRRLRFTTNHDESAWDAPPPVLFGGQDAALSAFVFSTFLGGVPLIYNGQEVGKTTTTPFFSRGTINWFDNPDVLATYRKLMQIYTSEPAARAAEIRWVDTGFHIATFVKEADNVQIMYIVNPRNATVGATPLPEDLEGQWVDMMTGASMTIAGSLAPAPHSFYILKRTL